MTTAPQIRGHPSDAAKSFSRKRLFLQIVAHLFNIALVGVAALWTLVASVNMTEGFVGRGPYRYMPELQVAAALAILGLALTGLVVGIKGTGGQIHGQTLRSPIGLMLVLLSTSSALYFFTSDGNIIHNSETLDWFPVVASLASLVLSLIWLVLNALLRRDANASSNTRPSAGEASVAPAGAPRARIFAGVNFVLAGLFMLALGTYQLLFLSIIVRDHLIDGSSSFPYYAERMQTMSMAAILGGALMMAWWWLRRSRPDTFYATWWIPPFAALLIYGYVAIAMDPFHYDVGLTVTNTNFLKTFFLSYYLVSVLGVILSVLWLGVGGWRNRRQSARGLAVLGAGIVALAFLAVLRPAATPDVQTAQARPQYDGDGDVQKFKRSFDANPPHYPWRSADQRMVSRLIAQIGGPIDGRFRADNATTEFSVVNLPWYADVKLFRLTDPKWNAPDLNIYYLVMGADESLSLFRLDGGAAAIHEVNQKSHLTLKSDTALLYLHYFTYFVQGADGSFFLLEDIDDPVLPELPSSARGVVADAARRASCVDAKATGEFLCDAVVFYANALFDAEFIVRSTGAVNMPDSKPIASRLPGHVTVRLK